MYEKMKYWVWLSSLVKIPPRKRFELLEHFKDPEHIWYAQVNELLDLVFLEKHYIGHLSDIQARKDVERHMDRIIASDMEMITIKDSNYPENLKNIYDPPLVLYTKGSLISNEPQLAVIGSRRASRYGLEMAEKISACLSKAGLTITSGMARGIDSKAHIGALDAGGRTIAILGCGVDIAYPAENRDLMKRISSSGTVISEYLPGTPPIANNFPARNRIISGMSMGILIVEASEKSGSLITANFALEQGREVFAIPGNIDSRNSTGTNRLIRDGAKIVLDISDILDELNISYIADNRFYKNKRINTRELDIDERNVLKKLQNEPMHIDKIAVVCGMNVNVLSSILVMLELKGLVEQLPGKMYCVLK